MHRLKIAAASDWEELGGRGVAYRGQPCGQRSRRSPRLELPDEDADKLHGHYGLERVLGLTAEDSEDEMELPRKTRDAKPPEMEEGPDSELTQRRRDRQNEIEAVSREFERTKERESPDSHGYA